MGSWCGTVEIIILKISVVTGLRFMSIPVGAKYVFLKRDEDAEGVGDVRR